MIGSFRMTLRCIVVIMSEAKNPSEGVWRLSVIGSFRMTLRCNVVILSEAKNLYESGVNGIRFRTPTPRNPEYTSI